MRCAACNRNLTNEDWVIDPRGELCKICMRYVQQCNEPFLNPTKHEDHDE
jgi:hypothetical protein